MNYLTDLINKNENNFIIDGRIFRDFDYSYKYLYSLVDKKLMEDFLIFKEKVSNIYNDYYLYY